MDAIGGRAMQLADHAHGEQQAGQQKQGPEDGRDPQSEKAERVGERQSPGRVAHDENGADVQAGGVLQRRDGIAVVGVGVVDELLARGPIGDKIARAGQIAGDRARQRQKGGEAQARDPRQPRSPTRQVDRFLRRGVIQLADHRGHSTGGCGRAAGKGGAGLARANAGSEDRKSHWPLGFLDRRTIRGNRSHPETRQCIRDRI